MIIEFLITAWNGLLGFILSLFPPLDPATAEDAGQQLAPMAGLIGSMTVWVNWPLVVAQVGIVLGLYFAFLGVKILRAVLGHVPMVGGNG